MTKATLTLAASLAVLLGACGDREDKTPPSAPATSSVPATTTPAAPVTGPGTSSPSVASSGTVSTAPLPTAPGPAAPPSWTSSPSPSSAPAGAPPSAAVATADAGDSGAGVYNKTCSICHAAGVGGAPKPGDKADWGPRIGQGKDVLYKRAIEGFTGAKGMMPPRGGNPALKDDEIKAAVDFMVAKSQ